MNIETVRQAGIELERQVYLAKAAGYTNAECILTPEISALLALAKDGKLQAPVELEFTAGPRWQFSETSLGECRSLETAWTAFRAALGAWEI